ncbi:MAG: FecR family protein [Bacteroidota bacterium]
MDELFEISKLIERDLKGEITEEERAQLNKWVEESQTNKALYDKITSNDFLTSKIDIYSLFDAEKAKKSIEARLPEGKVVSMQPNVWLRYAASILLPLLIGAGVIYYFIAGGQGPTMATIDQVIKPGQDQAILVLSDGRQVKLDDHQAETSIDQGTVTASRNENTIEYILKDEDKGSNDLVYNELYTPRGGTYQVKLSDGTIVTLNAESSLKYPIGFTDSTRTVQLTGEAYFDVSHDGRPFIVNARDMNVRVLGTQFNVNAYQTEPGIETTLVEGKVQLESERENVILAPGDQGTLLDSQFEVKQVNTKFYTSWISGKLDFNNVTLSQVMDRLARWYDFKYEFKNQSMMNYHFTATFDKNQPISEILEMLSLTTNVEFKITEEKTIIIQ